MSHRFSFQTGALAAAAIAMSLGPLTLAGQQPAAASDKSVKKTTPPKTYTPPRTAWGDPDLQGVYTFATQTPFQRPVALGEKDHYTEAEQKEQEQKLKEKAKENIETNEHFSYNALWFVGDAGRPTGRTSLIVDPENGRLPQLTEHGQKLRAEYLAMVAAKHMGRRSLSEPGKTIPTTTNVSPGLFRGSLTSTTRELRSCRLLAMSRFSTRACTMFASSPRMEALIWIQASANGTVTRAAIGKAIRWLSIRLISHDKSEVGRPSGDSRKATCVLRSASRVSILTQ